MMKATLTAFLLLLATASGFAQGKVTLANDINSPFVLGSIPSRLYPADVALAGKPIPVTGPLPSGRILAVGLYAGPTTASLTLQGKVDLNPVGGTGYDPGTIAPTKIILMGLPGGTEANFQVRFWENTFASYETATAGYVGVSPVFTMIPGASIAYPNIYNGGSTTWLPGPLPVYLYIPEPSLISLTALGAALWIFHRRKHSRWAASGRVKCAKAGCSDVLI